MGHFLSFYSICVAIFMIVNQIECLKNVKVLGYKRDLHSIYNFSLGAQLGYNTRFTEIKVHARDAHDRGNTGGPA